MGYSPWGHKELDITEHAEHTHTERKISFGNFWGGPYLGQTIPEGKSNIIIFPSLPSFPMKKIAVFSQWLGCSDMCIVGSFSQLWHKLLHDKHFACI